MIDTRLTAKEVEVLALVAQGHDAKSAARELEVSTHTIYERLRRAREKLGASNSREAARMFFGRNAAAPDPVSDYVLEDSASAALAIKVPAACDHHSGGEEARPAIYRARTIVRAALDELPLRPAGQQRFEASGIERIRLIGELSARLAVAFVSISLAALVISNLVGN